MRRLTLDEVRSALPELEELRPVFDHLLANSEPDPGKAWLGSGQLGTVGSRLVDGMAIERDVGALAAREARSLAAVYEAAARALAGLASGRRDVAADALLSAAALEEGRDRPERAEAYAAAAHRMARDETDQRPATLALRRWARAARSQGKLSEALARYARAHEAALALRDARGAAEAAIGAGNVLEEQGRWADSAAWYRKALRAVAESESGTPERWHALLNLAIVTRSGGDLEAGERWLREAEAAAAAVDDADTARSAIENAWGQLAMARGSFGEGELRLRAALDAASGARARVTIGLNLAECLLAQGRGMEAAELAREAERDAIHAGLVPKLPEVYRLLGRIASSEGDADAFVLFERALEIIRERGLPVLEEASTLQAYGECEARRGDAEAARHLLKEASERFQALGMSHMRQTWADVYTGGTPASPPPVNGEEPHAG
jgi:tetratricopeptide (TPR) repeat protein